MFLNRKIGEKRKENESTSVTEKPFSKEIDHKYDRNVDGGQIYQWALTLSSKKKLLCRNGRCIVNRCVQFPNS